LRPPRPDRPVRCGLHRRRPPAPRRPPGWRCPGHRVRPRPRRPGRCGYGPRPGSCAPVPHRREAGPVPPRPPRRTPHRDTPGGPLPIRVPGAPVRPRPAAAGQHWAVRPRAGTPGPGRRGVHRPPGPARSLVPGPSATPPPGQHQRHARPRHPHVRSASAHLLTSAVPRRRSRAGGHEGSPTVAPTFAAFALVAGTDERRLWTNLSEALTLWTTRPMAPGGAETPTPPGHTDTVDRAAISRRDLAPGAFSGYKG